MDGSELTKYQTEGNAVELVQKHRKLIARYAKLAKGSYKLTSNSQYRWFYGLFLEGKPRNAVNLETVRQCITGAMYLYTTSDCYNQTVQFFLQLASDFRSDTKHYASFSQYIRMVLGWRLKYWVLQQMKHYMDHGGKDSALTSPDFYITGHRPPETEPFTMNIGWILRGSKSPAFRNLRAYDRYLLYLYFTEGYTMKEIAGRICKSKNTVNKDIRRIIALCKKDITSEL